MAEQSQLGDSVPSGDPQTAQYRVLLIEDSQGDVLLLREHLGEFSNHHPGQAGFDIIHCASLNAGLETLARQSVDIVLLDLGLPDCQGLDCYASLHARFSDVPVIILSGNADLSIAQQAMRMGAQEYLIKGEHSGETMARSIGHAVERHHLIEALRERNSRIENSERQMRSLIESHTDAIFVTDPDHRLLYANPAAQRMLAGTAQLLPGCQLPFAIVLDEITDVVIGGNDRQRVVAEMKARAIEWEHQSAILCSLRDISERKKYEAALEEIARGLSSLEAGTVFNQVANSLAQALTADAVLVVRTQGPGLDRLRVLAEHGDADAPARALLFDEAFLYRLLGGKTAHFEPIAMHGARPAEGAAVAARAGVPLLDRERKPAGFLLASWAQPPQSAAASLPILELFAIRAGNEIDRQEMAAALREERAFLQDVIDAVPVPVMVIATDNRLLLSNQAARDLHGCATTTPGEQVCCYRLSNNTFESCEDDEYPCPLREILREPRTVKMERVHRDHNGERHFVEVFAAPFWGNDGRLRGIIHSTHDITLRRRSEEALIQRSRQLDYLAHHDSVTGLPNRTLFMDRLKRAILRAERKQTRAAVLFVDLDEFKAVNDRHGHDIGDALLRAIGRDLAASIRASDTVARIGGDEFAILLDELHDDHDATEVAQKLVEDIARPQIIQGHDIRVGASIGISIYPDHDDEPESLLKKADQAMYRAKSEGRGRFDIYTAGAAAGLQRLSRRGQALREAINSGQLELFYQPQIAGNTERIVSVEALVRWQHPERGLLTPANFFGFENEPEAEILLGDWVLQTACAQFHSWRRDGVAPPSIAVNLSTHQIRDPALPAKLVRWLEQYEMAADCLELEISEMSIIDNDAQVFDQIRELDAMGIRITIDQFGSYHSVLANINRLPISKIKMDRSLVDDSPRSGIIVDTIIDLAQRLHMEVIAAGIENRQQSDRARSTPGLQVQGYHYAQPMSAEESARFLRQSQSQD